MSDGIASMIAGAGNELIIGALLQVSEAIMREVANEDIGEKLTEQGNWPRRHIHRRRTDHHFASGGWR
jgi:hypothetical protein